MPQRRLSLSKEISKVYEQTMRGNAEELLSLPGEIKGEYVLVLDGNPDTILPKL
jgi:16S rRNA C1402 (ribose-2'-O) methylase RsmI